MDPASGEKEEKKRRRSEVRKKVHCPMSGKVEKCSLGTFTCDVCKIIARRSMDDNWSPSPPSPGKNKAMEEVEAKES